MTSTDIEIQWDEFVPRVATSLPTLATLDDQCRCRICKDYMTGPMMTTCGHTFCSICIRRALNVDGRCPACRTLEEESKLRKNLLVEDLIESFVPLRSSLMSYTTSRSVPSAQKRTEVIDDSDPEFSPSEASTSQPRRSKRARKQVSGHDNHEVEELQELPKGHVTCPVCNLPFHMDKIEVHVDKCLRGVSSPTNGDNSTRSQYFDQTPASERRPQARPSSPLQQDRLAQDTQKRLPKPNYAVMNDTKLRHAMNELGLSTSGTRGVLQRRYTEYIAIWNSNLDAKVQKSKRELLKEIQAWDRIQTKPAQKMTNDDIDAAHKHGQYDNDFDDLVRKARESMKKRKAEIEEGPIAKRSASDA